MSKKLPPFSLRLTFEERARLEQLAGDMALGAYIKEKIFDGTGLDEKRARARLRRPVKDTQSLAQLLAKLGQSRIANNLNQLAKAANIGALPLTPETEADIRAACADKRSLDTARAKTEKDHTFSRLEGYPTAQFEHVR